MTERKRISGTVPPVTDRSEVFELRQIGVVRSAIRDTHDCPRQESEGAPGAWIEIRPEFSDALDGLETGMELLVLTWLHQADRSRLRVHPRGNPANPMRGVFTTRSPHRPNPIGLHRTRVLTVEPGRSIQVNRLDVIDGTPVVDMKSVG